VTPIPPIPRGFPDAEFEARLARAQALMRADGLDGMFVTQPHNFRYFSGFDMQFWESPTRPWFLVVPAEGAPVAVVPEIGAGEVEKTWIRDVRAWPAPRPEDDGVSLLADALAAIPRQTGRIGAELGREMSLRMPVTEFRALEARLAGRVEIIDGAPTLWRIRIVKTEGEIDRIRHACRIASAAYARVPELVFEGDTEIEACRKLKMEMQRLGADAVPFLPGISGPGGVAQIVVGPSEKRLARGGVMFFDTGAVFDGYFCDFDRNYARRMRRCGAPPKRGSARRGSGRGRTTCIARWRRCWRRRVRSAAMSGGWATGSACN
jgi:Xaa-Pro aminopeptidase